MENDKTIWEKQFPKGIPKDLEIAGSSTLTSRNKKPIIESVHDNREIESLKKDIAALKKDIKDIKIMVNKVISKYKKINSQHITNENSINESNTQ